MKVHLTTDKILTCYHGINEVSVTLIILRTNRSHSEIRSYSTVCCFHRGEGYFFHLMLSKVEDDAYDYDYLADKAFFGFQFDMCRNVSKVMYPSLCKETAPAYLVCVCVCMLLLVPCPWSASILMRIQYSTYVNAHCAANLVVVTSHLTHTSPQSLTYGSTISRELSRSGIAATIFTHIAVLFSSHLFMIKEACPARLYHW